MNIEAIKKELRDSNMDAGHENKVAKIMASMDIEETKELLRVYLDNERFQVRMMGLRLIKRCVKDRLLLEYVTHRCFNVERLTELQKWYSAILSRYPVSLFAKLLVSEIKERNDLGFFERHVRALQIELANGGERERKIISEVEKVKPGYS